MFQADDGYEDDNNSIDDAIDEAIYANNIDMAKIILCSDDFSHISLEDKEWALFLSAHIGVKHNGRGENILKYLIFDYKINEENSLNKFTHLDDSCLTLKRMFESRKLQEEINCELNSNETIQKKTIKV